MNESFEDDQLRGMISGSRVKMPFNDFEKDLMIQIKAENEKRKYVHTNVKLSWLFFGLGMITGISITIFISKLDNLIIGIDPEVILILVVFCLSMIFLLLMEKLLKISLFNKDH